MSKIVLVSHTSSLVGGSERSLLEIARYLKRQINHKIVVIVPSEGEMSQTLTKQGIKWVTFNYNWAVINDSLDPHSHMDSSLGSFHDIVNFFEEFKPDAVLTNNSVVPWFAYLATKLGIPHFWFIREEIKPNASFDFYPSVQKALDFINQHSVMILTNSYVMKGILQKQLGRDDIEVIYPSIDPDIVKYGVPNTKKTSGLRLLVYGAISEEKNQFEVVKAVNVLAKQGADLSLTIMGASASPAYLEKIKTYINDNHLGQTVRFLEHRPNPYPVVAEHDVCIVPSRFEAFGRVTVEAMLLKKIVIAADVGGSKEIIQRSGKYGYLYKLGDSKDLATKIKSVLASSAHHNKIVNTAYDYATEHFLSTERLISLDNLLRNSRPTVNGNLTWIDEFLYFNAKSLLTMNEATVQLTKLTTTLSSQIQDLEDALQTKDVQYRALLNSRRFRLASAVARLNRPLLAAKGVLAMAYKLYLTIPLWSYKTIHSRHYETPDNTPVVPVVICMWNRLDRLPKILHLLDTQSDVKVDLYIWNNSRSKHLVNKALSNAESYMKGSLRQVSIKHSIINVGGFGRFFYARRLRKKYPYVLFLDDDQDISTDFIKECLIEQEPHSLKSVWAFKIHTSYWDRQRAGVGQVADYCGTGGMLCDPSIFNEIRVFRCPQKYWFMEDLWLSFFAKSLGWKLRGLEADFTFVAREKDQGLHLVNEKENFYHYLSSVWLPTQKSK